MDDPARGWLFAAEVDVAAKINLDAADAPRQRVALGPNSWAKPPVSQSTLSDRLGPDMWLHFLRVLPSGASLTQQRTNSYGSARLYEVDPRATDFLATWTPQRAAGWVPGLEILADTLMQDPRISEHFARTGVVSRLMKARGLALEARSSKRSHAEMYFYWYEPLR